MAALGVLGAGCSSSSESTSATTTSQRVAATTTSVPRSVTSGVTEPVILTPSQTTATVKVGQVVTFDMGNPNQGSYVAVSDDPSVFRVDSEGKTTNGVTTNAGGTAMAAGTAKVSVSFRGSVNGVGTPTTYTITVTG